MRSLFSLLPLWLAATAVGLPLQSSPEDTWRSELDRGISRRREHREVVPGLHLHGHPAATGVEAVLGKSQSRLRKRGILQNLYGKARNVLWFRHDKERCLRRKQREFAEVSKPRRTDVYFDGHRPAASTEIRWREICSTWETANKDANTKPTFIGERKEEEWARTWADFNRNNEGEQVPNDEEDPGPSTRKFVQGGQDLIKQAWSYMGPGGGKAGLNSPGVRPGMATRGPVLIQP